MDLIVNDEGYLDVLIMLDEAHFYLTGYLNRILGIEAITILLIFHEKPLHSQKVTFWCCVSTFCMIGSYFFEENKAITMASECYCTTLKTFLAIDL